MEPKGAPMHPASKARRLPMWLTALGAATAMLLAACAPGSAHANAQQSPPPTPVGGHTTGATGTTSVAIVNFKFDPTPVTVKAGSTVEWTNRDGIGHAVDFSTPDLHSSVLNQNDRFAKTFTTPGSYAYICRIHPFMHGTLVVTN